jgi:spore maturation protein CgeB
MTTHRILIVGRGGDTGHLGGMFARAAARRGIPAQLVDAGHDLTTSWFDRIAFRLRGRRHRREDDFNQHILAAAAHFRPTVVLVTGLMPVRRAVLEELRRPGGAMTVNYMTDDPFNPRHRSPTALEAISAFDVYLSLKPAVDDDLRRAGARRICRGWFAYDPAVHFREQAPVAENGRWSADVTFIGGADRDRASLFTPLRRWSAAHGRSFAVFGSYWNRFPEYWSCYRGFANGPQYRYALTAAGTVLSPVRRANRDWHTMRTFEAAAAGAFMLLERTPDHLELFEEGRHAGFFDGAEELRDKCAFYLDREGDRRRMAAAAHARITDGGHTYADRLEQILQWVS